MIQIDLDKIVPIEDLPNKLSQIIEDAKGGAIYVVTKDDRPSIAVVSIDQLEGLSGRKVVTPIGESAPAPGALETPPLPPPPSEASPTPGTGIGTPTSSVQRDLTPSQGSGVNPSPASGASPAPAPPPPEKPPEEMAL